MSNGSVHVLFSGKLALLEHNKPQKGAPKMGGLPLLLLYLQW